MLSEWNEYGVHPFHSTAFVHTIAYACLNDWDGLILYNHHTSENWDDQPADEILNVFDAYNDPAVVCQWGFLASVFLKGLVSTAKSIIDVVYTQNDLRTLPKFHSMPSTLFPYISATRNIFLDGGDAYQGNADVAVNAGFLNGADLRDAKHGVYYAWSEYRDAMRRFKDGNRLARAAGGTSEIRPGVHLGERALVFDNISEIAEDGDYRTFAKLMDQAMKEWGVLPEGTGYVDGKLISDTKEMVFDPEHSRYEIHTPYCAYFSGAPEEMIVLSDKVSVQSQNERISISLLPVGADALEDAKEFVLTAMGATGMDETICSAGPDMMGMTFTAVEFKGKLYAETLEGILCVKAQGAVLQILNPVGEVLEERNGEQAGDQVRFVLNGEIPGVQYHLIIK